MPIRSASRAGRPTFGPQPDAFKAEGATTVINPRSNEETADLIAEENPDVGGPTERRRIA